MSPWNFFFESWVLKMYPPTNSGFLRPPAPTPQARPLGPLVLLQGIAGEPA